MHILRAATPSCAGQRLTALAVSARPRARHSLSTKTPADTDLRWLTTHRARLAKCITFGLTPAQTTRLHAHLAELSGSWRALLAGPSGYLTHSRFAGLTRHAVQWGELDSMAHVNNTVYNRWAESARVAYVSKLGVRDPSNAKAWRELGTPAGIGMILKSIKTEFKFPIRYPDRVSVFHKLARPVGEGSQGVWLDVVVVSERERRVAARLEEEIVLYDYRRGRKVAMVDAPFVLRAFDDNWWLQGEEVERRVEHRRRLDGVLREIETGSWDRADAKEDLGCGV